MPNITTLPPLSYNTGQVSTVTTPLNQNNTLEKSTNITQIYQNNYINTGDTHGEIVDKPIPLSKRTKNKALKTIAKLFDNKKLEEDKKKIATISFLTRDQIEDKIRQTLDKKYSKEPSFSHRTDKINDLHILLEKVNSAINAETSNPSSDSQNYINGLRNLALTLIHVYENLIIPLSFNIF